MAKDHVHLRGCWVKFAIDLHPSKAEDVMEGVREQLHGLLLRYNEALEGVVLCYSKERILSLQAKIHDYFPYFHVDVMALVFLFKPAVGAAITGTVNAIGQDYIGVLVLGIFNAAIGRAQILPHMQHRALVPFIRDQFVPGQENCWSSSQDRHSRIEVGSALQFTVHKVQHEGEFFTLAGSLLDQPARPQGPRPARVVPAAAAAAQPAHPAAAAGVEHQPVTPRPAALQIADGGSGASPPQPAPTATPNAAVTAVGGAQQPEHRKKGKRRHSAIATPALANGIDSAVKPPKKKKHTRAVADGVTA